MQRREYQLCLQGAHTLVKLTHKLPLIFTQARSWMKPMGKGTSCLDISCHWRLLYPTEIRISTTGEKIKINYYPAKLTNVLPLVPTSSGGKCKSCVHKQLLGCGCMHACLVAQSCLALCDSMACSPPVSPIHGIFQTRIVECVELLR